MKLFVQDDAEAIIHFVNGIRKAPPPIEVDDIITKKAKPIPSMKYFKIKPGPLTEEMRKGFRAMSSEFRDYRDEFRGFNSEFRDYRTEFTDFAKTTDDGFHTLTQKTKRKFQHLRYKIRGEISAKLP
ncbi:MAG: hypothetical protein JRN20_03920 [Nitrososphaerota archaeon]|nr:hypothetical protein [Nitrososphaerota archaeon]MDG6923676.1 hypothetical protein [Nitrososphaerota archaeon]